MKPTVKDLKDMFNKINNDCEKEGGEIIPFSNISYYSEQIENIFEVEENEAIDMAVELAELV